jgi:hypothetical protein
VKHIVYKYNDDHSDEVEFDARGVQILERGDIVSRHGVSWKVESIEHRDENNRKVIPTYWVYLARVLVN